MDVARVSHCYREANRVADILVNVGVSHPQQGCAIYDNISVIPKLAKGEIRLDKLGMSSVRRIEGDAMQIIHGKARYP